MLQELFQLSQHFLKIYDRPFQRYFLTKSNIDNRCSILVGPRGVGKTTIIIQYILKRYPTFSQEALYIQADHFMVKRYSLFEIAQNFHSYGGKLLCIDEIHKYPDWAMELKSIYDTFPELQIIASGSSALQIYKSSHDLSRRAILHYINIVSFREFLELHFNVTHPIYTLQDLLSDHQRIADNILTSVKSIQKRILELFREYLEYGCYPYYLEYKNKDLFYLTIEQGIHTTLESDLLSIYPSISGFSIIKIKKLLSFIAGSVPFTPDYTKIKSIIDVGDIRTLKNYLAYLQDGGLIRMIKGASSKLDNLEKTEKIYLSNTNQIFAIDDSKSGNEGTIRETFFLSSVGIIHEVAVPKKADFLVENKYLFEIGGPNKSFNQIKECDNAFLAIDGIEIGIGNKIPLWLFGFLY